MTENPPKKVKRMDVIKRSFSNASSQLRNSIGGYSSEDLLGLKSFLEDFVKGDATFIQDEITNRELEKFELIYRGLNQDVWSVVFSFMKLKSLLVSCSLVSKDWNRIISCHPCSVSNVVGFLGNKHTEMKLLEVFIKSFSCRTRAIISIDLNMMLLEYLVNSKMVLPNVKQININHEAALFDYDLKETFPRLRNISANSSLFRALRNRTIPNEVGKKRFNNFESLIIRVKKNSSGFFSTSRLTDQVSPWMIIGKTLNALSVQKLGVNDFIEILSLSRTSLQKVDITITTYKDMKLKLENGLVDSTKFFPDGQHTVTTKFTHFAMKTMQTSTAERGWRGVKFDPSKFNILLRFLQGTVLKSKNLLKKFHITSDFSSAQFKGGGNEKILIDIVQKNRKSIRSLYMSHGFKKKDSDQMIEGLKSIDHFGVFFTGSVTKDLAVDVLKKYKRNLLSLMLCSSSTKINFKKSLFKDFSSLTKITVISNLVSEMIPFSTSMFGNSPFLETLIIGSKSENRMCKIVNKLEIENEQFKKIVLYCGFKSCRIRCKRVEVLKFEGEKSGSVVIEEHNLHQLVLQTKERGGISATCEIRQPLKLMNKLIWTGKYSRYGSNNTRDLRTGFHDRSRLSRLEISPLKLCDLGTKNPNHRWPSLDSIKISDSRMHNWKDMKRYHAATMKKIEVDVGVTFGILSSMERLRKLSLFSVHFTNIVHEGLELPKLQILNVYYCKDPPIELFSDMCSNLEVLRFLENVFLEQELKEEWRTNLQDSECFPLLRHLVCDNVVDFVDLDAPEELETLVDSRPELRHLDLWLTSNPNIGKVITIEHEELEKLGLLYNGRVDLKLPMLKSLKMWLDRPNIAIENLKYLVKERKESQVLDELILVFRDGWGFENQFGWDLKNMKKIVPYVKQLNVKQLVVHLSRNRLGRHSHDNRKWKYKVDCKEGFEVFKGAAKNVLFLHDPASYSLISNLWNRSNTFVRRDNIEYFGFFWGTGNYE